MACPIHTGNLLSFAVSKMHDISSSSLWSLIIFKCGFYLSDLRISALETNEKMVTLFKKEKPQCFPHYWTVEGCGCELGMLLFKGTVQMKNESESL